MKQPCPSEIKKRFLIQAFHNTQYHYLVPSDEIVYGNESNLQSLTFRFLVRKILEDLSFLLYIRDQDFWDHLRIQEEKIAQDGQDYSKARLRLCLQSCLAVFARKAYRPYIQSKDLSNSYLEKHTQNIPSELLQLWEQLKKVVLLVYCRMSRAQSAQQMQIVFESWYLDTAKLLDICLIYGDLNPSIVRSLVSNVFRINPKEYEGDFRKVLELTLVSLEDICQEIEEDRVEDIEQFMSQEKELERFHQPFEAVYSSFMMLIFRMLDLMLNLECILRYFPNKYRRILNQTALIYKRCLMIHCKINENLERKWKLGDLMPKIATFTNLITLKIINIFANSIEVINDILQKVSDTIRDKNHLNQLKKTYINICYFSFVNPPLFYLDRQNSQLPQLYATYTETLMLHVLSKTQKHLFGSEKIKSLFNRNHPNFHIIQKAAEFQVTNRRKLEHLQRLKQAEKWKLKSFSEFQRQLAEQNRRRTIEQIKISQRQKTKQSLILRQYCDEPEYYDDQIIDWQISSESNKMQISQQRVTGLDSSQKKKTQIDSLDISFIEEHHTSFLSSNGTLLEDSQFGSTSSFLGYRSEKALSSRTPKKQ